MRQRMDEFAGVSVVGEGTSSGEDGIPIGWRLFRDVVRDSVE